MPVSRSFGDEPTLTLRRPLGATLRAGHPWVYREAVQPSSTPAGTVVRIVDARGAFVGRGLSDEGPIAVRLWTSLDEPLGAELVARRLRQAMDLRARVMPPETNAYRLVNGEGDRMPGVVVDIYHRHAVLRFDGSGAPHLLDHVRAALATALPALGIEHLLLRRGRGKSREVSALAGQLPTEAVRISEHGMTLLVDLVHGQKTGAFLDHRESRLAVRALARDGRVLNLYAYTGGFSIAAALGGAASVTSVDVAREALALAEQGFAANADRLGQTRHETICADVADHLRKSRAMYELVIADPPSFAPNETAVENALEAYQKLHRAALEHVVPGGYYVAASCSSHVDMARFDETLRRGAARAGRVLQVLDRRGPPSDHPRLLAFPEGDYLKVILTRVV